MTDNYAFGGYMVRKHGWPFDLNGGFWKFSCDYLAV